jgi:hypothetical protein
MSLLMTNSLRVSNLITSLIDRTDVARGEMTENMQHKMRLSVVGAGLYLLNGLWLRGISLYLFFPPYLSHSSSFILVTSLVWSPYMIFEKCCPLPSSCPSPEFSLYGYMSSSSDKHHLHYLCFPVSFSFSDSAMRSGQRNYTLHVERFNRAV